VCPSFVLEARPVAGAEVATLFDAMSSRIAVDGKVTDVDFVVADRSYLARRFQLVSRAPHALLVSTALGDRDGHVMICSALRPPAEGDPCQAAISHLISAGMPSLVSTTAPSVLGVRLQLPANCRAEQSDVRCSDASRLSWKRSFDPAALAALLPAGTSGSCSVLGRPATCVRSTTDLPDGAELQVLGTVIDASPRATLVLCSWFGAAEPAPLCRAVFAAPGPP
jgi:hypothetical protein